MQSRSSRIAVVIVVETLVVLGVTGAVAASAAHTSTLGALHLAVALAVNAILLLGVRIANQRARPVGQQARAGRGDERGRR